MPVWRDADGNIVDERTRLARDLERPDRAGDGDRPLPPGRRTADIARPSDVRESAPTEPRPTAEPSPGSRDARRYGAPATPVRHRAPDPDAGRTRLYRPGRPDSREADAAGPAGGSAPGGNDSLADPPVGWLAIVRGPGKGRVATLGIGVNSIGRDHTERVSLDYGDETISRTNHGAITYDPRGRKFYVQPGAGTNLTYVGDEPVLTPRELEPSAHVQVGDTVLRFVPLCGADFSWDDGSDRD